MANKMELTYVDFNLLNEEYDRLINVDRPKNLEDLKEARAQGDLSENAEYDAARDRQREIEGRIKEIEYTNKVCVVLISAEEYKKVEDEYNSIRTSEDKLVALKKNKLEIIVNSHKIVDSSSNLNKYVTVLFEDTNEEETYYICGTIESDPLNGKISNECPLGEALLRSKVNDRLLIVSETDEKYYVKVKAINTSLK